MVSSAKLALSVLLRAIRSSRLGRNLKAFVLRCLLLWPRIWRGLRNVCSSYFQISSVDENNTKKDPDIREPSIGALRKREEYVVVCASHAFGGVPVGEPSGHHMSGSQAGDEESHISMEDITPRSPSVYTLSSRASSRQGSPRLGVSAPRSLPGSSHPSASSLQGSVVDSMEHFMRQSNAPANWTHDRAVGRTFTGVTSRGRSRPPSPSSSPFPFLPHSSRPSTPTRMRSEIDIPAHLAMIQQSLDSEGSPSGSSEIPIEIMGPSRSGTLEDTRNVYSFSPPESPSATVDDWSQYSPTHDPRPSTEVVNPSSDSQTHSPSGYGTNAGGARQSRESMRSEGSMTLQWPQAQAPPGPPIPFPEPSIPGRPPAQASAMNVGNPPFRPGTPPVTPMHSDQVSRYVKNGDVPRKDSEFWLLPMQVKLPHSYTSEFSTSGDWIPKAHPEGALYFYHKTERIFTDVYMYDPALREEVEKSAELLYEKRVELESHGRHFPTANYDLVLDIVKTNDNKTKRLYYFVDHNTRTLFWLEIYDMNDLLNDTSGVKEPSHIKLRLESLYWVHWSLYPVGYRGRNFPDSASNELLEILLSSSIDSLTSKVSTAPYSVADMQTMRDVMKEANDLGPDNPHTISSLARLLSICVQWKFMHFHGQKTSRLSRYKSIYKDSFHKRSILFRLLSLILFFTPDVHLRELKKVWADELIIEEIWRNFMQKLVSEWVEFVLYSTVMLAANVAFLAVPGVINVPAAGSQGWIKASAAQIASSMSLVFSIGSIIAGLLLIRRNRTMGAQDAMTACAYLVSMTWPYFYLEPLAVLFSLTYALLMWSVCAFFVALLAFSLQNATTRIRACVGTASGIVIILIVCCIINCWEKDDGESEKDGPDGVPQIDITSGPPTT